ncbi:unnamed protein product, partial [Dicrocoelium dendriticum]
NITHSALSENFICNCVGSTDRILSIRKKERVPKWLQHEPTQQACPAQATHSHRPPSSSIGRHLLISGHQVEVSTSFKRLLRHTNSLLLRSVEAVAINRIKPELCVQKQLSSGLRLNW